MAQIDVDNDDPQRIQLANGIDTLRTVMIPELQWLKKKLYQDPVVAKQMIQANTLLKKTLKLGMDLSDYINNIMSEDVS